MKTEDHKHTIKTIFAALADGDSKPFVDAMRDDFSWTISGQGPWGRTWQGKVAVRDKLIRPLFAQFGGTYRNRARRVVGDGNIVVVECKGDVDTKAGDRYDNDYCYICRFADDGRLVALTEYMDTALAERVLTAPPLDLAQIC